jgi:HK97 family phage portal protein
MRITASWRSTFEPRDRKSARPRTSFVPQVPLKGSGAKTDAQAATFGPSQSLGDPNNWLFRAIGGGPTKAGPSVSEYTAINLPVVYACINRIANPIGFFPLKIFKGDQIPVTDHPLSQKLGLRPNDSCRRRRCARRCRTARSVGATAMRDRAQRPRPGGRFVAAPLDRTSPVKRDDRLVYRTNINGRQFEIDQEDVIHIMGHSRDGYLGLSPITSRARRSAWASRWRSSAPSSSPTMRAAAAFSCIRTSFPPQAKENLRDSADKQGGLDNAHRIKVLDEGMKYEPVTINPEDAQFLGSREFQTAEIARIYDVPLILLQSHEKTTSWGTGIEQLMIGFVQMTLAPWVNRWEQELNWKLFTPSEIAQGYYVKFNMNALLRGDMTARAAFYQSGILNKWFKRSEARAFEELPPWEGIDDLPEPPPPTTPPNVTQERTRE